jgi:hypothetical protein
MLQAQVARARILIRRDRVLSGRGTLGRTLHGLGQRFWLVGWLVVLSAGCNGFPDPVPIAEARIKPEKYPGYTAEQAQIVTVNGQPWQVLPGAVVQAPAQALQPVNGGALYTVRGDRPPLSTVLARMADGRLVEAGALY